MQVIRDNELGGILMIPLFTQYGLNRCNVSGCVERHTTIITGIINAPFALCDFHYHEFKGKGRIECKLEF